MANRKDDLVEFNFYTFTSKYNLNSEELANLLNMKKREIAILNIKTINNPTNVILLLEELSDISYKRIIFEKLTEDDFKNEYSRKVLSENESVVREIATEFLGPLINYKTINDSADFFNKELKKN